MGSKFACSDNLEYEFHRACENGNFKAVQKCLKRKGWNINSLTETGLLVASERGHVKVVQLLLDNPDIQINLKDWTNRNSLMSACKNGHLYVVRELLKRKETEVNETEDNGHTALSYACEGNFSEIVVELLKNDEVDVNKSNPLESTTNKEIRKLLEDAGAKKTVDIEEIKITDNDNNINTGIRKN